MNILPLLLVILANTFYITNIGVTLLLHYPEGGVKRETCLILDRETGTHMTCWQPTQSKVEQVKVPEDTYSVIGTLEWVPPSGTLRTDRTAELNLRARPINKLPLRQKN